MNRLHGLGRETVENGRSGNTKDNVAFTDSAATRAVWSGNRAKSAGNQRHQGSESKHAFEKTPAQLSWSAIAV